MDEIQNKTITTRGSYILFEYMVNEQFHYAVIQVRVDPNHEFTFETVCNRLNYQEAQILLDQCVVMNPVNDEVNQ